MKKLNKIILSSFLMLSFGFVITGCAKSVNVDNNSLNNTNQNDNEEDNVKTYKIDFYNYDDTLFKSIDVKEGEMPILDTNPKKESDNIYDYEFIGWDNELVVATADASYKATFNAKYIDYTINFIDGDNTISNKYHYNDLINIPNEPSKEHHKFLGWSEEIDGDVITISNATKNINYYSIYEKNEYTYNFYDEKGNVIKTDKIKYLENIIAPSNPTKEGTKEFSYEFDGWYTKLNGGEKVTSFSGITGNVSYYAKFNEIKNKYTYNFYDDNGNIIKTDTVNYGTKVEAPTISKQNTDEFIYEFDGWYTKAEGGEKVTDFTIIDNINLYARFKETKNEFEITWLNSDGTLLYTEKVKYGVIPSYSGVALTKTSNSQYSYTFSGWSPSIKAATANATYKAEFIETINKYTYKFYNSDGSVYSTATINYGQSIVKPKDPTMPSTDEKDFTFAGWYTAETGGTKVTSFGTITCNVSYYARFAATNKKYSITFYITTNTVYKTITLPWGSSITLPEDPKLDGYKFMGWSGTVPTTMPKENKSYYATWEITKYTLTIIKSDSSVSYSGATSGSSYGYDERITLNITTKPTQSTIKWVINGKVDYTGDSYTLRMPASDFTITIKMLPYIEVGTNKIEIGLYPQSKVTDSALISKLRANGHISSSSRPDMNYWSSFGETTTSSTPQTIEMYYIDVTYNNQLYRGIYFSNYRPKTMSESSLLQGNSWSFNNGYTTGIYYWFKYEPITWIITLNDNNKQYMYTEFILDAFYFNKQTSSGNNYSSSNLRTWTKNTMEECFTSKQMSLLTSLPAGGNVNTDKYISAKAETINSIYVMPSASVRKAKGTDYAKCRGLYASGVNGNGYSEYWTSSAGTSSTQAKIVNEDGAVTTLNVNKLSGIRPFIAFDSTKI